MNPQSYAPKRINKQGFRAESHTPFQFVLGVSLGFSPHLRIRIRYVIMKTFMPTAQWGKPKPVLEICLGCIGLGVFWRDGKPVYCEKCGGLGKVLVKPD